MSDTTSEEQELRARRAASFGSQAAAYAEHRPGYPRAAFEWGLSGVTGKPGRVLDLAAGTGKATETLVSLGLDVVAVEPDDEMRTELATRLPEVTALPGTAESIPLPDASVDAVFVGQAFHWFDVDAALTEIARVLRPGGTLVPLWNDDDVSVPWVAEFGELLWGGEAGHPFALGFGETAHPDFEPFDEARFPYAFRRTTETLLATVRTHSAFIVADPSVSGPVLAKAREFLAANPETTTGEFDFPLVTLTFRARRR